MADSLNESNPFFTEPILNSPYEYPGRHWELDETGQPTQQIRESRRVASFITPIPKPKKRRGGKNASKTKQSEIVFADDEGLSTEKQQYDPNPVINELRREIGKWRQIDNPATATPRCSPHDFHSVAHWGKEPMPQSLANVTLHFVFSTKHRQPLLKPANGSRNNRRNCTNSRGKLATESFQSANPSCPVARATSHTKRNITRRPHSKRSFATCANAQASKLTNATFGIDQRHGNCAVLRPNGASLRQPQATPGVPDNQIISTAPTGRP